MTSRSGYWIVNTKELLMLDTPEGAVGLSVTKAV